MGYPERACFAFESGAGPAASLCPREPVLCSWGTQLARAAPTRPPSCVPPACRSVGFPHSSGSRAHLASLQTASRTPAAARGERHVTAQRWTHGFTSPLRRRLHCVPGLPAVAYQRRFQGGFHVLRSAAASPMPLGASHHDTCTDFGTDGSSGPDRISSANVPPHPLRSSRHTRCRGTCYFLTSRSQRQEEVVVEGTGLRAGRGTPPTGAELGGPLPFRPGGERAGIPDRAQRHGAGKPKRAPRGRGVGAQARGRQRGRRSNATLDWGWLCGAVECGDFQDGPCQCQREAP